MINTGGEKMPDKQEKQPKKYNVSMTHQEIVEEIQRIEANENYQLFQRLLEGQKLAEKMAKLLQVLPKKD